MAAGFDFLLDADFAGVVVAEADFVGVCTAEKEE